MSEVSQGSEVNKVMQNVNKGSKVKQKVSKGSKVNKNVHKGSKVKQNVRNKSKVKQGMQSVPQGSKVNQVMQNVQQGSSEVIGVINSVTDQRPSSLYNESASSSTSSSSRSLLACRIPGCTAMFMQAGARIRHEKQHCVYGEVRCPHCDWTDVQGRMSVLRGHVRRMHMRGGMN